MSYILLSFDVEEFDMPLEYGQYIPLKTQLAIGNQGLEAICPILYKHDIATTLFTTATFALNHPSAMQQLAQNHEIASHTYYHSNFEDAHLQSSKEVLEKITGQTVTGLRMPRMRKVGMNAVKEAGYTYDSSINPTWLPGRYNNLHLPRTFYQEEGMLRIPASVSPGLRIPLFWLAFKNMSYSVFRSLAIQTLHYDGYLCLYFHPWEFTYITSTNLPGYTKRWCGASLVNRLNQLIGDLKNEGEFMTMQSFAQSHCQ